MSAERLRGEGRFEPGLTIFPLSADSPPSGGAGLPGVSGSFFLTDRDGKDQPARLASAALIDTQGRVLSSGAVSDAGEWTLSAPSEAGEFRVRFFLDNRYWAFSEYAWESASFHLEAGGSAFLGKLRPEPGSRNAAIGLIHLTYLGALDYFARQGVSLHWWTRTLGVDFPASGDYFNPADFKLHLTRAEAWDVNLHELGHAMMAASMKAAPAGGQHKIDECYGAALAWSEGWASFFAAAVRLDPADPDARFEFLVPRRAPIRIENVPQDVCAGQTNEWRVAAALWDVLDSNEDGSDHASLSFAKLWRASQGQKMGSLTDYIALLGKTLDPESAAKVREALAQNTILSDPELFTLSRLAGEGADGFSRPDDSMSQPFDNGTRGRKGF